MLFWDAKKLLDLFYQVTLQCTLHHISSFNTSPIKINLENSYLLLKKKKNQHHPQAIVGQLPKYHRKLIGSLEPT